MNPREQTPEERAMIALAEGRNAFANLRKSHAELLSKLERLEMELARFKRRDTIFIDAVSEIMATAYRKSDQKIENIIAGCIFEIQSL